MLTVRPRVAAVRPLARAAPLPRRAAPARRVAVRAAAASSPEPPKPASKPDGFIAARLAGLKELATPFSDPVANGRLVALCVAQMLCSVATLIHDT